VGADGRIIAEGPYGQEAEATIVVSLDLRPTPAAGTAMADVLREKGYHGP